MAREHAPGSQRRVVSADNPTQAMSPRPHAVLDPFIPTPDRGGRHQTTIHAPAELVMEVARNLQIQSLWPIRALFAIRAKVLGGEAAPALPPVGFVRAMLELGWGRLAEEPGRYFAAGAACRPWQAEVAFTPIAAENFAAYAEPDKVKIAWTLEAEALGPALTRFATETRVAATDEAARRKFRRYWRMFGVGIVAIRWILLGAVRREAERQWRERRG